MGDTKSPTTAAQRQLGRLEQVRRPTEEAGQIGWAGGFDAVQLTGKQARALRALTKSVKHPKRKARLIPDPLVR
jgi:hypothetical protein